MNTPDLLYKRGVGGGWGGGLRMSKLYRRVFVTPTRPV